MFYRQVTGITWHQLLQVDSSQSPAQVTICRVTPRVHLRIVQRLYNYTIVQTFTAARFYKSDKRGGFGPNTLNSSHVEIGAMHHDRKTRNKLQKFQFSQKCLDMYAMVKEITSIRNNKNRYVRKRGIRKSFNYIIAEVASNWNPEKQVSSNDTLELSAHLLEKFIFSICNMCAPHAFSVSYRSLEVFICLSCGYKFIV